MRKCTLPILPVLLAAILTGVFIPTGPAHAQSKLSADPRDQEIELLKTQVQQLEQRVDTLEGLDRKVKVIDQKLDVQAQVQQQQELVEQRRALSMPIVKANDEGFWLSSPNDAYKINFGGIIQGTGRFFTSGGDKNVSSTFYLNRVRPILSGTPREVLRLQYHARFRPGQRGRPAGRLDLTPSISLRRSSRSANTRRRTTSNVCSPIAI